MVTIFKDIFSKQPYQFSIEDALNVAQRVVYETWWDRNHITIKL